ncbi:MAG: SMP-30/gluconolactonase/LRE family protein [Gemmatimonadota bacterium]|nr:SMP-30/gluconolactonase/LRE family protein [Gemmatimonadota bacterium]
MSLAPIRHRVALVLLLAPLGACGGGESEPGSRAGTLATEARITIADVGFATPESVLHDTISDVYLVSNINGDPLGRDDNGFISRVAPDGSVIALKWIDGSTSDATLNAPKGMAVSGSSLFVADIDCVRIFDLASGAPTGEVCVPEATFLNDIAADEYGTLWVTDTGFSEGFAPSGTDAVYRMAADGRMNAIAEGDFLGHPNGIAVGSRGIFVVTFGSGEVFTLTADGERTTVLPASDRQLDGVEFVRDGGFMFSSWGEQAVLRVGPTGALRRIVTDIEAPADIGYDARRNRVLIPLFNANQVLIEALDG